MWVFKYLFFEDSHSSFYICSVAAATTDESGALGACQSKISASFRKTRGRQRDRKINGKREWWTK